MNIKQLTEFRCPFCSKLLARYSGVIEIKCPRCKKLITSNASERRHQGDVHGKELPQQHH